MKREQGMGGRGNVLKPRAVSTRVFISEAGIYITQEIQL